MVTSLNNTLSRTIDVPAGASVTVSSDLWYSIEDGYDFYAEYSTDGGARWTQVGRPITGDGAKWAGKRWSFKPAVAGDVLPVPLRHRRRQRAGCVPRQHQHQGRPGRRRHDGAENGDNGWTVDGWKA